MSPASLGAEDQSGGRPDHHGLGNGDLYRAIGSRALGVDDDADFVVDQIVRIIGKEEVDARPGNPCRLWIGQRDLLGRPASAAARSTAIPVIIFFVTAGRIERREILPEPHEILSAFGQAIGWSPGIRFFFRLASTEKASPPTSPAAMHFATTPATLGVMHRSRGTVHAAPGRTPSDRG